jgi:hypothetical protein
MKNPACIARGLAITIVLSQIGQLSHAQTTNLPMYGAFSVKADMNKKLIAANNLGVAYVRESQVLARWSGSKNLSIDFWKAHKKKVVLNINNDTTPSPFPTNLVAYEEKLRSFLNVYSDSIELAVIENEELNQYTPQSTLHHLGSMQDYINELTVAVNVCQEMSIPVTKGGLTCPIITILKHYYTINGKMDSVMWLVQQVNGVSNDSTLWLRTDSLLNAFRNLPLTYVNLHWYEPAKDMSRLTGVLQVVCNYITQQTGKRVITNETGVKTTDSSFVTRLAQQWDSAQVDYCIFFDGFGALGAQPLTTTTGGLLKNGIAFRNFVAGVNSCPESIAVVPAGIVNTCSGNSITLTASGGFSNYLWSNGDTSQSTSVNTMDNYSVRSSLENCTAFSNAVALTVKPLPSKPIITTIPSPPTNVCPSKTVKLTSSFAPAYFWNTGDTSKAIIVNKGGNYFVTVADTNGCKNTSAITTVTYQTCNPPANLRVTDITAYNAILNWDTLTCAIGYQLFYRKKGTVPWTVLQVVQGSTSSRKLFGLTPSTIYQWQIQTRCKVTPDTLLSSLITGPEFTTLAKPGSEDSDYANAERVDIFDAKIFPVPAKNNATLTVGHVSNDLKIILTDLSGKVLWESKKITDKNISLPVAGLAKGIYMIIVKDKEHNKILRLLKE